jgi:DNA-directed RNA polymerase
MHGEELAAQQLALEHEAYTLGEAHFKKTLERQMERGEFADNATARPVLSSLVPLLATAFTAWMEHQVAHVRRKHVGLEFFQLLKAENVAAITVKVVLNMVAKSGPCSVQNLAVALGRAIEEEARFGRIREEEAEHFNKHIRKALNKRNGHTYKVAYLEKVEAHMQEAQELQSAWISWDAVGNDITYHMGIRLIELLIESTQLVEMKRENAGNVKLDAEMIHLTQAWADKLCSRAYTLAGVTPRHQPMIVPPRNWEGMIGGGYWAKGRKPTPLIRVRSKRALQRYSDVAMPEVYKAVNIAQASAWAVDTRVLEIAKAVMAWKNVPIDKFPMQEREELPVQPVGMAEDPELLKAWKKEASGVYRRDKARVSRRLSYEFIIEQASKFAEYEAIYFPYNLDWRGRVYAIPAFNPQGNDMTKGLLKAAKAEPVGKDGIEWLKIHGANCAGVDKVDFEQRKSWVNDNEALILEVAADPLNQTAWMQMDSPFCFLAFCFEWAGVKEHGEAWESALPIAFDGSCSGIQHFSAMLRDERGGRAVNLLPSKQVQDIYRLVSDEVVLKAQWDAEHGTEDSTEMVTNEKTGEIRERRVLGTKTLARGWLAYGITRKVTKRSVMTLAYGSKAFGFTDQVREDIIQPAIDSGEGAQFFPDAQQCARYMAGLIWDSVSVVVVAAVEAMNWLQKAAKLLAAEVTATKKTKKTPEPVVLKPCMPVYWVTPDGFPVWQEYMLPVQRRVELMFLGTIRLRSTVNVRDSDLIDGRKQESGIAPNFVHSQDGSHLRKTVVKASEAYGVEFFALIHDSFGTIPAHAGKMFKAVRETMVETYSENDVLADFREQFMEQLHSVASPTRALKDSPKVSANAWTFLPDVYSLPEPPGRGSLDLSQILHSDFAFA